MIADTLDKIVPHDQNVIGYILKFMDLMSQALLFTATVGAVFFGARALLPWLEGRAILDHPNERSSHQMPTPKGGGIVVMTALLAAWAIITVTVVESPAKESVFFVIVAAALLAALSWADDLRGLSPLTRLAGQFAAVIAVLFFAPAGGPYFQGLLPGALDLMAAAVLWVWFINLFNFMDGIDGISCVEAICLGIGIALVAETGAIIGFYGLMVAAAAAGFVKWNWHPARLFLGDVGSVPLGFVLGWLLLELAADGQWAAALILPAYYLMDATVTLVRRALRGEKVWQAHKEHFYQQAVQGGLPHAAVARSVLAMNSVLVVLAIMATKGWQGPALLAGALLTAGFLKYLAKDRGS